MAASAIGGAVDDAGVGAVGADDFLVAGVVADAEWDVGAFLATPAGPPSRAVVFWVRPGLIVMPEIVVVRPYTSEILIL